MSEGFFDEDLIGEARVGLREIGENVFRMNPSLMDLV